MANSNQDIDFLIARCLTNEASEDERSALERWCLLSEGNQSYYNRLKTIYEKATLQSDSSLFDVDAAWNKVLPAIRKKQKKQHPLLQIGIWSASAAATIAIIMSIWLNLSHQSNTAKKSEPIVIASSTTTTSSYLPDSSKVIVMEKSSLTYAGGFGKTNRRVRLRGNAFFEVKHQSGPPFIVEVNNTFIRDIGTAFSVNSLGDTSQIVVYVKTGCVIFYTNDKDGITLTEGETGIYNKQTKEFSKITTSKKEEAPRVVKSFDFKETSLSEVVQLLSKAYEVNIILKNPKLGECTITVSFKNENVDTMIEVIAETLNLSFEKKNSTYILNGEECLKR